MITKSRIAAVGLSLLAAGGLSVATAGAASANTLSCTPHTYNTAGSATCTGSGTWRIRLNCQSERDYTGPWVSQNGGSVQQSGQCRFKNRATTVETQ